MSCAGQVPPQGGPPDTEPPRILSVYPAPSTLFFQDSRIVLEFDEHVDHQSVEGSIFVSPSLGPLEFDWSGNEVEISFIDSLRSNTTYVFSLGTDVVDLRNKNRMAEAFSLAFSTGDAIDPGAITGSVYPASMTDQLSGIFVFAYNIDTVDPDTLNPSKSEPDYVTQTGKTGEFHLTHLALGTYRLLAVRDEYKNLLYDPETDEYGAAAGDVQLAANDTMRAGITMKLAREDTTAPRLVKVTPLNRGLLLAELSEPIDTSSFGTRNVQVSDSTGKNPVQVLSVSLLIPQRKEFFVATQEQKPGLLHELRIHDAKDLSGKDISQSAFSIQFVSSDLPDTSSPAVASFSFADSTRGIELRPLTEIRFTEPVRRVDWRSMVDLRDSLDRSVHIEGGWANDAVITARPVSDLAGSAWYSLIVRTGSLQDWKGMTGRDTIRAMRFQTLDSERLSTIAGLVNDPEKIDTIGRVVVTAWPVGKKDAVPRSVTIEGPGPFELAQLPEGQYVMQVFRDRNGNKKFDAGRVFPYQMSERFSVAPDTLKLRARWPLENVQLRLR